MKTRKFVVGVWYKDARAHTCEKVFDIECENETQVRPLLEKFLGCVIIFNIREGDKWISVDMVRPVPTTKVSTSSALKVDAIAEIPLRRPISQE